MICPPCKAAGQWTTWASNATLVSVKDNATETAEDYHEYCKGAIQRTQCDCQHKTDSALVRR